MFSRMCPIVNGNVDSVQPRSWRDDHFAPVVEQRTTNNEQQTTNNEPAMLEGTIILRPTQWCQILRSESCRRLSFESRGDTIRVAETRKGMRCLQRRPHDWYGSRGIS